MAIIGVVVCTHAALNYDRIMMNPWRINYWDLILGVLAALLVLEMTRRILSWILPAIALITILYAYLGPYLPDAFAHRGFSLEYIIETLYMSTSGIWGAVTGVSATIMAGFLIFGSFLFYTGGAKLRRSGQSNRRQVLWRTGESQLHIQRPLRDHFGERRGKRRR